MGRKGEIDMKKRNFLLLIGLLITIIAFLGIPSVLAKPKLASVEKASPLHPRFA
jgi:hypothetical protein